MSNNVQGYNEFLETIGFKSTPFRKQSKRESRILLRTRWEDKLRGVKNLGDLIRTEHFKVDGVRGVSHSVSFTPHHLVVDGGSSHSYSGGFTTGYILKVTPANKDLGIKELGFDGALMVRSGERIYAKIPLFTEETISLPRKGLFEDDNLNEYEIAKKIAGRLGVELEDPCSGCPSCDEGNCDKIKLYRTRPVQEREKAIEIGIVGKNEIYSAIDYENFVKSQ